MYRRRPRTLAAVLLLLLLMLRKNACNVDPRTIWARFVATAVLNGGPKHAKMVRVRESGGKRGGVEGGVERERDARSTVGG